MPLDPQARAWLDAGRAAGVLPYQELGIEQARRLIDMNAVDLFGALEEVAGVDDVDLDGVPGRVYEPTGAGAGALVWLHGGGWAIGSLESHDPLCRALAARSGSTVVAVDYRLAPEHPHPAALEDAWTATTWAAGAFGPVAVGGDSAGGHLAAVVALRARDRGVPLRLQVLVVPVTDYAFETASYAENATGYGLERKTMEWFWDLYVPGTAQTPPTSRSRRCARRTCPPRPRRSSSRPSSTRCATRARRMPRSSATPASTWSTGVRPGWCTGSCGCRA